MWVSNGGCHFHCWRYLLRATVFTTDPLAAGRAAGRTRATARRGSARPVTEDGRRTVERWPNERHRTGSRARWMSRQALVRGGPRRRRCTPLQRRPPSRPSRHTSRRANPAASVSRQWLHVRATAGSYRLRRSTTVWQAVLEVRGPSGAMSLERGAHPAAEPRDQQNDRLDRVMERVGVQLLGLKPDRGALPAGQRPTVEDQQQLVALIRMRCPVHHQQRTDLHLDADLLPDLPGSRLCRRLARLDVATRDVPELLVCRPNQHDPPRVVEEQDTSGDVRPAAYGWIICHASTR